MIGLLFPGQGSQTPGMLSPWLELPGARDYLGTLGEAAGIDLIALGTTAEAETIKDTAVAQPLIVGTSLLTMTLLAGRVGEQPQAWAGATAGHSVGEFGALAAAGVLTDAEAVELVGVRGRAMAAAAALAPSGMAAVVGGDPEQVSAALAAAGLVGANVNGGGQVVAAGAAADLERLAADPPARARVIPLAVAGAFHTSFMSTATEAVAQAAQQLHPQQARIPLLTNADASVVSGTQALQHLVSQITSPVRWDLCQQRLVDLGVSAAVELAPGGVLAGLARRAIPEVTTVALKKPDDLDTAAQLVAASR